MTTAPTSKDAPSRTVSVVIPARNEAENLPALFGDLSRQKDCSLELVVADAESTDSTVAISEGAGAKVVPGGLPAAGRNAGAEAATGAWLLFLDADVRLTDDFVRAAKRKLTSSGASAASFGFNVEGGLGLRLGHWFSELYFSLMTALGSPRGIGGAILVREEVHRAIGGFDTTIKVGEDHEYLGRAKRHAGYRYYRSPKVYLSVRRFDRRGGFTMFKKWVAIELHRIFRGEVRDDRFDYFDEVPRGERGE